MENAAIDIPSPLDYDFNIMMTWDEVEQVEYKNTYVQNQWTTRTPPTKSACTCFWLAHISTEQNFLDWEIKTILWEELRDDALKLWAKDWWWWSLQWALKLAKNKWLITWYTKVWTLQKTKQALNIKHLIYTWSNKIDWKATKTNDNVAVYKENSPAHCFCIVGYNETSFIAKNSYWAEKYDWWYFYIPFEMFNDLFSRYAITDKTMADKIIEEKIRADKESVQKVLDMWLLNWLRMDETMTREEFAIVVGRLLKYLDI